MLRVLLAYTHQIPLGACNNVLVRILSFSRNLRQQEYIVMVERPIKKSERQTDAAPSDAVEEVSATEVNSVEAGIDTTSPVIKRNATIQPVHRKDKTKGQSKGQGKGREAQNEPQVTNRALVRGPKPQKTELPTIKPSQAETSEDATSEPSQSTAVDG